MVYKNIKENIGIEIFFLEMDGGKLFLKMKGMSFGGCLYFRGWFRIDIFFF